MAEATGTRPGLGRRGPSAARPRSRPGVRSARSRRGEAPAFWFRKECSRCGLFRKGRVTAHHAGTAAGGAGLTDALRTRAGQCRGGGSPPHPGATDSGSSSRDAPNPAPGSHGLRPRGAAVAPGCTRAGERAPSVTVSGGRAPPLSAPWGGDAQSVVLGRPSSCRPPTGENVRGIILSISQSNLKYSRATE